MLKTADIHNWFQQFKSQNIVVVGDVMVDAYIWGKVSRISPEAPVPIINITKRENRLGGAANVALNLKALGANCHMLGAVGKDTEGDLFKSLMAEKGIFVDGLLASEDRRTTVKTRILSQGQQMLRVDEEHVHDIKDQLVHELLKTFASLIEKHRIDAVVLEDYNKGLLTPKLIFGIISTAKKHHIPVCVDPKKENFWAYKGATLFKPNLKELAEGFKTQIDPSSEDEVAESLSNLRDKMDVACAMVTLSEYGVQLHSENYKGRISAHKREISDVSGAGDTVIAVATLGLACKLPLKTVAELSNLAGGLVCEEVGVVPIDPTKLEEEAIKVLHA